MVKKKVKKNSTRNININKRKNIVNKNLLTFFILFAVSLVLYYSTGTGVLNDIFYFAMILFGSLVLAFFIIFLVIFFLRILKKK